jgi:methylenetetrahydrofolate dehydrogenase (NADP+) / methenyltetrahydrofolate cyclohydrolase
LPATVIDGKAVAEHLRSRIAERTAALARQSIVPGLAVVLVGDDPASQVYVANKTKQADAAGLRHFDHRLPASTSTAQLISLVQELNSRRDVHGILVQLPLPPAVDSAAVLAAIDPAKDVDGFHAVNAGRLALGQEATVPCTPLGCLILIRQVLPQMAGKRALVIGRSNIVGKPMAMLLLQASATVTICHSATPDLAFHTRQADIVVAAVGKRNVLTADMVKPGAVVIDVGMNRDDNGKLCGDVDFAGVSQVASAITPVPGGVGPMTITMLLVNTIEAAERAAG